MWNLVFELSRNVRPKVPTASASLPSFWFMASEAHLGEVEKVLLYVSEARERAAKARVVLERDGASEHLLAALRDTELRLEDDHRKLMQGTFFAVPSSQDQLAV